MPGQYKNQTACSDRLSTALSVSVSFSLHKVHFLRVHLVLASPGTRSCAVRTVPVSPTTSPSVALPAHSPRAVVPLRPRRPSPHCGRQSSTPHRVTSQLRLVGLDTIHGPAPCPILHAFLPFRHPTDRSVRVRRSSSPEKNPASRPSSTTTLRPPLASPRVLSGGLWLSFTPSFYPRSKPSSPSYITIPTGCAHLHFHLLHHSLPTSSPVTWCAFSPK